MRVVRSPLNTWSYSMQLTLFAPAEGASLQSPFGKTSPASSRPKTTRSAAFLEHLPEKMLHSSRQGKNGRTLVVCLDPRARWHGGSSTPNISEWPNAAAVCSLSQVLEKTSIPATYFLSSTACAGILRRAANRGKTLPEPLHRALALVASQALMKHAADTSSLSPVPATFPTA